ncbi:MAG: DUF4469 domain-containing protein [Bacteroidales bacterium]|nr:DUF4469 domain-containing protein [Bacteroidales bacterium]
MSLKYALYENNLTSDPDDYSAVVQDVESLSMEAIVDQMLERGSTVTRADALSVLEDYSATIESLMKKGKGVNTPLFNLHPSIKGVFLKDDQFDKSRHFVRYNITPGIRIKTAVNDISVEKVQANKPRPVLIHFEDLASGTRNETITSGKIGSIKGSRLKFNPAEATQGIFFIATDNTNYKVDMITVNKPSELHFLTPDLPAGDYQLQVRTVLRDTAQLRTGTLEYTLTVQA